MAQEHMSAAQSRDHLSGGSENRAGSATPSGHHNARVKPVPSEHDEQKALMVIVAHYVGRWPELQLLYAIPNGGKRHIGTAKKLCAEGVKSGVPDLCLPVARGGYHGLYVELKRSKGGTVSSQQASWIAALQGQGYRACVCRGADEAMAVILEYMRHHEPTPFAPGVPQVAR
jgi:hypothetical protein